MFGKASLNSTDLTNSFVDWSVHPPDQSMGLWREVLLHTTWSSAKISAPIVETLVSASSGGKLNAQISVGVRVLNADVQKHNVLLVVTIPSLNVRLQDNLTMSAQTEFDTIIGYVRFDEVLFMYKTI